MQSANLIMIPKHKLLTLVLFTLPLFSLCQENSPYSRYGIGNLSPKGNVLNRGMGGISAGFADPATINSINPASYSNLVYSTLDIGAQVDSRTLKSTVPVGKFTSNNAIFSYLQLGIPLLNGNKKALKKNISWGMNFGLKPVSRINYKIEKNSRLTNIDSLATLYEGTGGANEALAGMGLRIKNFSLGFNVGYLFGNKDYSTRLQFINDTVNYLKSNSQTHTSFGGVTLTAGMQYVIPLDKKDIKKGFFRLGAYGDLKKKYNALQNVVRETFSFNNTTGATGRLDSVYEKDNTKGSVQIPATYGAGFTFENQHLLIGFDFEETNWNSYTFYGQKDSVRNNWMAKAGIQYLPADIGSRKYWNFVRYRAGIYYGPDYIAPGKKLQQFGVTVGAGLPLKLNRSFYETQYSVLNIGLEFATRGTSTNNIRESVFRVNVGFSLSDLWFRRYKYE
jgi:hypothetical protein